MYSPILDKYLHRKYIHVIKCSKNPEAAADARESLKIAHYAVPHSEGLEEIFEFATNTTSDDSSHIDH